MQLADNKSKDGSPFLTKLEVEAFIKRAFGGGSSKKKLSFNVVQSEQMMIWRLFYNFYNSCTLNSEYDSGKQGNKKKYIELVTKHFTNWRFEQVDNNFSRSNTKLWKPLKTYITNT